MTNDPSNPNNTLSLQMTPLTNGGYPNVANSSFTNAITSAKKGGSNTFNFFNATNETSDFWGWMASHDGSETNPFVPGTDNEGNPIMMASNGNISMRMGAFYHDGLSTALVAGAADDAPPPVTGIGTIQTGNTTNSTSRNLSFALTIAGIPAGLVITKALFGDLLAPIYANMKTFVTKMAKKFQSETEVEGPTIDAAEESVEPLEETSSEIEEVGGDLAEEGVAYLAVDWSSALLEAAGLGAIVAIPLIVSALGHQMTNSLSVINQTTLDFEWGISHQASGELSVVPSSNDSTQSTTIPQMEVIVDMWGDTSSDPVAYEADFQFINSSDYGSIGYVMSFTPSDGGTPAQMVVSIPWAGENSVWVGESSQNPSDTYNTYSDANGLETVTYNFDNFAVTVSITALQGETNGQYFYGVLAVIEPLS
jgi:hypothetical protein